MGELKLLHELNGHKEVYLPFVYNTPSFLKSNNNSIQKHFYGLDESDDKVKTHLAVSIRDGVAFSALRSPFGGVEVAEGMSAEVVDRFLSGVELQLKDLGVKEVCIHQNPESYQNTSIIDRAFIKNGFNTFQERVYHGIKINGAPLNEQMTDMQRRRLKKCERAGFEFRKVPKSDMVKVFEQIDRWRKRSSKPLSMTWADLENSKKRNPHTYMCFGIYDRDLIAATIVVKVNDHVLYHFFPASDDQYNQYSPMVMLVNGIYRWGQENNFKLLDLGTSYIQSQVNRSLVNFKERLGGQESLALSWRKTLS